MDLLREVFYDFIWDGIWPGCLPGGGFVACGRIVAFREVVVKSVLWCGCVWCGVGVGVRVKRVLPWRGCYVVRGGAGVFFLKVVL